MRQHKFEGNRTWIRTIILGIRHRCYDASPNLLWWFTDDNPQQMRWCSRKTSCWVYWLKWDLCSRLKSQTCSLTRTIPKDSNSGGGRLNHHKWNHFKQAIKKKGDWQFVAAVNTLDLSTGISWRVFSSIACFNKLAIIAWAKNGTNIYPANAKHTTLLDLLWSTSR